MASDNASRANFDADLLRIRYKGDPILIRLLDHRRDRELPIIKAAKRLADVPNDDMAEAWQGGSQDWPTCHADLTDEARNVIDDLRMAVRMVND